MEIAINFNIRHLRYPTFWLDKVCIDQNSITDREHDGLQLGGGSLQ